MSVTAFIIARDEERRIERCLDSLGWADEIVVVVDDRTADATAEVARRHTDRVFVRRFEGYPAQRQFAQDQARSDWVFWVDCDEVVAPGLAREIGETLEQPRFAAYRVPRRDYMFGRWIRHGGWYPQYHVRLYRREGVEWSRRVHEVPEIRGDVGTLREPVLHFAHTRVRDWLGKMTTYTALEAQAMHEAGARIGPVRILFEPPLYFGYKYIVQQGWRDGMHGLALALLLGGYRLARDLQLWDLQQSARGPKEPQECPPPTSRS